MRSLFERFRDRLSNFKSKSDLVTFLLNDCLFLRSKINYPKCKHSLTRQAALKLVEVLTYEDSDELFGVVKYL